MATSDYTVRVNGIVRSLAQLTDAELEAVRESCEMRCRVRAINKERGAQAQAEREHHNREVNAGFDSVPGIGEE